MSRSFIVRLDWHFALVFMIVVAALLSGNKTKRRPVDPLSGRVVQISGPDLPR